MTVTLRITNDAGRMHGAELQKVFDEEGGVIGRASGSDWVLPDPDRFLSSRHAAIYFKDDDWYLADTSANGVYVNDESEPVGNDRPLRLNDGDRLRLGDYEVEVRIQAAARGAPPMAESDRTAPTLMADFQAGGSIPETLDPLELLSGRSASPPPPQPAAPPADPLAAIGDAGPIGRLDLESSDVPSKPFLRENPVGTGADRDDVAMVESGFRPPPAIPAPIAAPIPEDWDLLVSPQPQSNQSAPIPEPIAHAAPEPPPIAAPVTPAAPAPVQSVASAAVVPPAPPATPAVPAVAPAAPAVPAAASAGSPPVHSSLAPDAMLQAFFEGAGLDPAECLAKADPELPRLVGQMFREVVAGMQEVLEARSHFKSGFRMNVTLVRRRENNPLKFAAGGTEEALQHLLFHSGSGYQPPIEAVREGFADLKQHQVAMISGMKATLLSVLKRFEPETLAEAFEQRAKKGSLLSSRRARYWELYTEFYEAFLTQVEDDFQDSIGRIFAQAYEEQIARLAAAGKTDDVRD